MITQLRASYQIARADFWERIQRYSFVLTLAATGFLGLGVAKGDIRLHLGQFRGVFNSAWTGLVMAMTTSTLVSLAGFYLVKNSIERDRQTGLGQILGTCPITRLSYLTGKFFSNLAVLAAMLVVLVLAAALTQLISGKGAGFEPWALVAPFLFLAVPALALVAGLAVFFEAVPWLRGGFGNLVYFCLWVSLLCWGLETHNVYLDFTGFQWVADHVGAYLQHHLPEYKGGVGLTIGDGDRNVRSFVWPGGDWIAAAWWLRLYWLGIAFGFVCLGALWFDRFNPATASRKPRWVRSANGELAAMGRGFLDRIPVQDETIRQPMDAQDGDPSSPNDSFVSPGFRFGSVVLAELRLMLKGQRWWWYGGAAGFLIASLVMPLKAAREELLPFVWLWPVLLWSPMGTREARYGARELLFTAPGILARQLPAVWLAGVVLAVLTGSGIGIKLALVQDWSGLLGWCVGALFIPSAALAMGVWSGSSKLFEALFMVCWYIGPAQKVTDFNFMTTAPAAVQNGLPAIYLAAAGLLLAAAFVGRRRQLTL